MNKPKWLLFDYGETLIHEEKFDDLKGMRAVMARAARNPKAATAEDAAEMSLRLYPRVLACARGSNLEIPSAGLQRLIFGILGVEFDLPFDEFDEIYWDAAAPGTAMDGMDELLSYINGAGIKSGVISNIGFSGRALKNRIDRLLPGNGFGFVIASSDYTFRKPERALFDLAIAFAGCGAGDIWFMGDNAHADIEGASGAGMFPVLLRTELECAYRDARAKAEPLCEHLLVHSPRELAAKLRDL